jgi:nicotinate-nucleotide adenylyltransferase
MRIGIFGGTYDPPHQGHLILAAEAQYQLSLDKVLWVLTPLPPHKLTQQISSLPQRLNMLSVIVALDPAFELSTVDIDREPPHYSADTVNILHQQYPGAEMVFLMGGDSLHDLPTWHEAQRFVDELDELGVMRRPEDHVDMDALEEILPGVRSKVKFIYAPLLEISSREIRRRAAAGEPYRFYLPPQVYDLIRKEGYYLDAEE